MANERNMGLHGNRTCDYYSPESTIIAPSLTYIFNLSITTGIFVDDWKDARVTPIYKSISILTVVSKIFEKAVFEQLYYYLNDNNLTLRYRY